LTAYYLGGGEQTSLSTGYLTPTQKTIWKLKSTGLPEASVARKLNVTRQTVHKALDIANSKVQESLEEIARINKIKIQTLNPANGVLIGYSSHFKTKAIVTFSAKTGIQVWYRHEGDCRSCEQLQTCKETLLAEAKDRNIPTPENPDIILPSEFAKTLFSKITGEPE
jgi:transcriptional regulator